MCQEAAVLWVNVAPDFLGLLKQLLDTLDTLFGTQHHGTVPALGILSHDAAIALGNDLWNCAQIVRTRRRLHNRPQCLASMLAPASDSAAAAVANAAH